MIRQESSWNLHRPSWTLLHGMVVADFHYQLVKLRNLDADFRRLTYVDLFWPLTSTVSR